VIDERVRIEAFSEEGISLGDRVTIGRNAALLASGVVREPGVGISIGHDTAIGADCILWGQGGISIGSDTLLGPGVVMVSENHRFDDPSALIRLQGHSRAEIRVGDDCWIGAGAKVLAGVTIGKGCVIGAGSVVTRDVEDYSICLGVPARTIGKRGTA
jgi:acetyltransferase-like isoleucine patch superfamily enzyme